RHHTHHGAIPLQEGYEGRPHRDTTHVVGGAVDGVDDPHPVTVAGPAVLLPDHGIAWPCARKNTAQRLLDHTVGLGDRSEIRFGVHHQVKCAKTLEGDVVGSVGEHMCQP